MGPYNGSTVAICMPFVIVVVIVVDEVSVVVKYTHVEAR